MDMKILKICCILFCLVIVCLIIYFSYPSDIQVCKNLVRDRMIDPNSVQFTEVRYSKDKYMVCGYYNARNRMGGYVGRNIFSCNYRLKKIYFLNEDVLSKRYLLKQLREAKRGEFDKIWKTEEREIWDKLYDNEEILNYCI